MIGAPRETLGRLLQPTPLSVLTFVKAVADAISAFNAIKEKDELPPFECPAVGGSVRLDDAAVRNLMMER
jgi:hypothetical protein